MEGGKLGWVKTLPYILLLQWKSWNEILVRTTVTMEAYNWDRGAHIFLERTDLLRFSVFLLSHNRFLPLTYRRVVPLELSSTSASWVILILYFYLSSDRLLLPLELLSASASGLWTPWRTEYVVNLGEELGRDVPRELWLSIWNIPQSGPSLSIQTMMSGALHDDLFRRYAKACEPSWRALLIATKRWPEAHPHPSNGVQRKSSMSLPKQAFLGKILTTFWGQPKVNQWKYAAFGNPNVLIT